MQRASGTLSEAASSPARRISESISSPTLMKSGMARASRTMIKSHSINKFDAVRMWHEKQDSYAQFRRDVIAAARPPQPTPIGGRPPKKAVDDFFATGGKSVFSEVPPAVPVARPKPVLPPIKESRTLAEDFKTKQEKRNILTMAENGLNSRFSDMFKAFQYIDLDRSGRLSRPEIARALDMWNVPIDDHQLDLLFEQCDKDGDGVSYEEFVDALARDAVAPAAMGKRGMQSKEAMGVDAQEMLAHQLGHSKQKKFTPTIN